MASHHAINELVPTKVSHEKKRNQPKQVWLRNSKGETRSVRFQVFLSGICVRILLLNLGGGNTSHSLNWAKDGKRGRRGAFRNEDRNTGKEESLRNDKK